MDSLPDLPPGVVPLTPALADAVADRLAPEHAREIRELSGLAPRAALRLSLSASLLAYAVLDSTGEPLFVIGVEPAGFLTNCAQVWMVGVDGGRLSAHARKVLRCARRGLCAAFRATGADRLEQHIPAWYATGLRFARRLGFTLEKENVWAYPHSTVYCSLEQEHFFPSTNGAMRRRPPAPK